MSKLSEKEIEAIRKRAEMATEGPWQKDGAIDIHSPNGTEVAAAWGGYADQEFIAHAREDIPKLLAEIERLRKIIEWNVSCVVCVNQLGEGWKYDDIYGELICGECFDNRYGGDVD